MRQLTRGGVAILAAATLAACRAESREPAPDVLRYLTWTSQGSFSNALIERLTATLPNTSIVTEPTSGSFSVVSALQRGEGDFGFATADVVYLAYRRGIEPNLVPHSNLRAIAVRWTNSVSVVVPRDSSIRTVADLARKRVGVAPQGSSAELLTRILLEAHGVKYADLRPEFQPNNAITREVRRGSLDAGILEGTPLSDWGADGVSKQLRLLPISRAVLNQIRGKYPFVKPVVVWFGSAPAGAAESAETVGADSVLVCRRDLREAVAYQLTKELSGLLRELAGSRPEAAIDPDNAPATPIPLHTGAARYYREQQILN